MAACPRNNIKMSFKYYLKITNAIIFIIQNHFFLLIFFFFVHRNSYVYLFNWQNDVFDGLTQ